MEIIKKPQTIVVVLFIIAIGLWQLSSNPESQTLTDNNNAILENTNEDVIDDIQTQPPSLSNNNPLSPNQIQTHDIQNSEQHSSNKKSAQAKTSKPPTVYAGEDFSMDELERTFLEGKGSAPDGSEVTYQWLTSEEYFLQTKGIDYDKSQSPNRGVKIFSPNSARTKLIAPETEDIRFIELYLVVTDKLGQWAADKITITVHNVALENVAFYDVDMPDINLRECTEEYANEHLLVFVNEITELHCNNRGITNLSGLEYFGNLKTLTLVNNNIRDIWPLASLKQLTTVNLGKNNIYDLRPLASLTYLSQLNLHQNDISDVTPLTELNLLVSLNLANNKVEKLQYFGKEFEVKELNLSGNPLNDLAPLGFIAGLETLDVSNAKLKNIYSLFRHNYKLRRRPSLHTLNVSHNPDLSCQFLERLEKSPSLKLIRKGVCVQ